MKGRLGTKYKFLNFMKISFHSYANKTNFHMKSFVLSLTFIMRFTATKEKEIKKGYFVTQFVF